MTSQKKSTTSARAAGSGGQQVMASESKARRGVGQEPDQEFVTVVIDTCSHARRVAIAAELWVGRAAQAGLPERLELGRELVVPVTGSGAEVDLAERLVAADRLSEFRVWSPPVGEWLGTLVRYTPAQGFWTGDCDARGDLVFTETRLRSMLEDGPVSKRRMDELTGRVFITQPQPVRQPEDAAGHRIAEIRELKPFEVQALAWYPRYGHTPTALVLDDGTVLVVSSDPEGNGPGALHILSTPMEG